MVPTGFAATGSSGCTIRTDAAIAVDDYYIYGTAKEIWQESNGIAGLQRQASPCATGPQLAADTCIKHTENGALVSCAVVFGASALP